jgi:hypothetical protein
MCTPSSIKEESDLSSGPPSSDSGYEATPNYITMSSSSDSSPRRPYFNSMYDRDDQDFLDCPYNSSMQTPFSMNGNCRDQRQSSAMHPLAHQSHPQPQSPLFYNQNYTEYPFYNTGYYPNALGITPCQENTPTSTSSAAAVAVAAASSTAAAAAAAVALMRSPAGGAAADLLSHQDHYSSMPPTSNNTSQQRSNNNTASVPSSHFASYQPLNMPENAFNTDI